MKTLSAHNREPRLPVFKPKRSRMAEDEIELADDVMALKLTVEKLQAKLEYLTETIEDMRCEKEAKAPLAAWVDEELFVGGKMNLAVPFLSNLHNVRAENALLKARYETVERRVVTTRDLLALPHEKALLWKNFAYKALAAVVKALERQGVRWPAKGSKAK
jgi:uncharacterized coiled-coil protein SlyX